MALKPISIQPLQERNPIVDEERRPLASFIRALNLAFRQIAAAFNDQAAIVQQLAILAGIVDDQGDLIAAQAAQIADLEAQQEQSAAALSLQNSGVTGEAGNLTCNAAGLISIPDHTRTYGNPTLNPAVTVDADLISTGEPAGETVYVFYNDPTRGGGAVTYQSTTDNGALAQTGDLHCVGYVDVPGVGTNTGIFVRPR